MSFYESKKPTVTEKGLENKAPQHRENSLQDQYKNTQKTPYEKMKEDMKSKQEAALARIRARKEQRSLSESTLLSSKPLPLSSKEIFLGDVSTDEDELYSIAKYCESKKMIRYGEDIRHWIALRDMNTKSGKKIEPSALTKDIMNYVLLFRKDLGVKRVVFP